MPRSLVWWGKFLGWYVRTDAESLLLTGVMAGDLHADATT